MRMGPPYLDLRNANPPYVREAAMCSDAGIRTKWARIHSGSGANENAGYVNLTPILTELPARFAPGNGW